MTTQQSQPQTEQSQELALRIGRLEGLMEMLIEQQRTLSARLSRLEDKVDRLLYTVIGGGIAIIAAIIGVGVLA